MLTPEQSERYARHVALAEVGAKGQERLLAGSVLVVGAGGLGSPVALYLAAAGVGTIGLVDGDTVDEANLQRQVIHSTADVGRPKVESAREKMIALNPGVVVKTQQFRLTMENAESLVAGYDVVVECTDSFGSKHLVNDACVKARVPFVTAGVVRFAGQVLTVIPGKSACFRCLVPEPPAPEDAPTCKEVGVLGVVPGMIGTIQAAEALKLLLGVGDLLTGRLLTVDALTMTFREIKLDRNPKCLVCGSRAPAGAPREGRGVARDRQPRLMQQSEDPLR